MRSQGLPYVLVAVVIGLVAGCGGSATTSATPPDPDVTPAKKDLLLAYRVANKARLDGLRCSVGSSPDCHHPGWYPSAGALVAEIGAEKLHRLTPELATSIDQVAKTGVTYILSDKTRRKSVVLAQKTSTGTALILHASPSGSTFSQGPASGSSDSSAISNSSRTVAQSTVSVPRVSGMSLSAAKRTLERVKLGWSFGYKPGESPSGSRIVRGQHPSPGSRLPEYKPVKLDLARK